MPLSNIKGYEDFKKITLTRIGIEDKPTKSEEAVTPEPTKNASDSKTGVTSFELTLDTENKQLVHWHVEFSGACDCKIQVSLDNTNWYDTANTHSATGTGIWDDWDFIGFRYVKLVVTAGAAIDVTALISAK